MFYIFVDCGYGSTFFISDPRETIDVAIRDSYLFSGEDVAVYDEHGNIHFYRELMKQ